jgi:two-component system, NarL family, response regulator LiaR
VAPLDRPDLVEGALTLGVADVVPVSVTGSELLTAVERVAAGHVVDRDRQLAIARAALRGSHGLTERETEILQLVASGLSNQDIAQRLFLSVNSIKTYIRTTYRKIGVHSRSEAVLWAVRHHLAQPARTARPDGGRGHGWRLRPPAP